MATRLIIVDPIMAAPPSKKLKTAAFSDEDQKALREIISCCESRDQGIEDQLFDRVNELHDQHELKLLEVGRELAQRRLLVAKSMRPINDKCFALERQLNEAKLHVEKISAALEDALIARAAKGKEIQSINQEDRDREREIKDSLGTAMVGVRKSKQEMKDEYQQSIDEKWKLLESNASISRCEGCDFPVLRKEGERVCVSCQKLDECVVCKKEDGVTKPADTTCQQCAGAMCYSHKSRSTCEFCCRRFCDICAGGFIVQLQCEGSYHCVDCVVDSGHCEDCEECRDEVIALRGEEGYERLVRELR